MNRLWTGNYVYIETGFDCLINNLYVGLGPPLCSQTLNPGFRCSGKLLQYYYLVGSVVVVLYTEYTEQQGLLYN
jgi:hypothetical protein